MFFFSHNTVEPLEHIEHTAAYERFIKPNAKFGPGAGISSLAKRSRRGVQPSVGIKDEDTEEYEDNIYGIKVKVLHEMLSSEKKAGRFSDLNGFFT